MQCTVNKLCYAYMFCLWFSCSYLTWKDFLFGDDRPWHPFKSGSSKQMCTIQGYFFYYYSACSQSSQRVMQVIAFPPHLCLCLAVQIKVLPKLFFRESDHQVGWCPSGRFNLMGTRLSHLASIFHPLFKLHDQPIFFSLLPDHIFHPWHIPQMFFEILSLHVTLSMMVYVGIEEMGSKGWVADNEKTAPWCFAHCCGCVPL